MRMSSTCANIFHALVFAHVGQREKPSSSRDGEVAMEQSQQEGKAGACAKDGRSATREEKRLATYAVRRAISDGRLVKPSRCARCAREVRLSGHHRSYAIEHRLDVEWLCDRCHRREHAYDPIPLRQVRRTDEEGNASRIVSVRFPQSVMDALKEIASAHQTEVAPLIRAIVTTALNDEDGIEIAAK